MGGGKGGGGGSQPDYAMAQADQQAAQMQYNLGQQQLQWGKDQFNQVWPYAQQYMQQESDSSAVNTQNAKDQQSFYDQTYKPIESQFAGEASGYNSPARAEANAGAAKADVANAFDAQRATALSSLESYGIDPSQTRFGALDLSTRISQAAATAAAGTQSRINTEATGLSLQGAAINIGRGYPGDVAQSYNTAQNAGSSGIATANSAINTGTNSMGSAPQYFSGGNQAYSNAGGIIGAQTSRANAQDAASAQAGASTASGIGSLVGAGVGIAAIAI